MYLKKRRGSHKLRKQNKYFLIKKPIRKKFIVKSAYMLWCDCEMFVYFAVMPRMRRVSRNWREAVPRMKRSVMPRMRRVSRNISRQEKSWKIFVMPRMRRVSRNSGDLERKQ